MVRPGVAHCQPHLPTTYKFDGNPAKPRGGIVVCIPAENLVGSGTSKIWDVEWHEGVVK